MFEISTAAALIVRTTKSTLATNERRKTKERERESKRSDINIYG